MFDSLPVLSCLILLPAFAAMATLGIDVRTMDLHKNSRYVAIFSAFVTLMLTLYCDYWYASQFAGEFVLHENYALNVVPGLQMTFAVDSLALTLITLTNFIFLIVFIYGEEGMQRSREFFVFLHLTQSLLIAFFSCRNLFMFYIFFEATLVPLFFVIGIWGGAERTYAAFHFFLMTFLAGLGFLVSLMVIYKTYHTFEMSALKSLMSQNPPHSFIWWSFLFAFAVKVPVLFLHSWLPNAHVQAPTSASMILAGVMLKLGGYGLIRCNLDLLPYQTLEYSEFMRILSIAGILYAAFVALAQTDMKRMVAYSSVSHMGFVTLGLFNLNLNGISGATFQMISHGLTSTALFMVVGMLYQRGHTRDIYQFQGLSKRMPVLVACMGLYAFALLGLPGTSGFIGEFLVYLSTAEIHYGYLFVIALSSVVTAGYALILLRRIAFGGEVLPKTWTDINLNGREYACLGLLGFMIIVLGIQPSFVMRFHNTALEKTSLEFRKIPDNEAAN